MAFEEVGKLESGLCAPLRLLQFLPGPFGAEGHASYGRSYHRSPLEYRGIDYGRGVNFFSRKFTSTVAAAVTGLPSLWAGLNFHCYAFDGFLIKARAKAA